MHITQHLLDKRLEENEFLPSKEPYPRENPGQKFGK